MGLLEFVMGNTEEQFLEDAKTLHEILKTKMIQEETDHGRLYVKSLDMINPYVVASSPATRAQEMY